MYKYDDFILESHLFLLLEGKMIYSTDFKKILARIDNPIAKHILDNFGKDQNLSINFVFPTDKDDTIGFTDTKKASEKWKIESDYKEFPYFNISPFFIALLKHFNIKGGLNARLISKGTIGEILTEINSDQISEIVKDYGLNWSRKDITLCHFKADDGRETVIEKAALEPIIPESKMNIKIGRFVRKFLDTTGYQYKDADIENFVNQYKSAYAILNDAFRNMKIVKGDDIKYWYHNENYTSSTGSLGNSCMRYSNCQDFFDIYTQNDNVSMVIMLDDIQQDKINGRALLWKLDNSDLYFMDRVYTINDADVNIFIEYAKSNGWIYKAKQNSYGDGEYIIDGEIKEYTLKVTVNSGEYDHYPYMDTMKYYKVRTGLLTNDSSLNHDYMLEDTDGGNNTCSFCGNEGRVECGNCDGSCEEECRNCDGEGKTYCLYCDDGSIECSSCDGDGYTECVDCNGTGEIDGMSCNNCSGEGKIKCDECKGDGKYDCSKCDNGRVECSDCSGDGTVECSDCHGRGTVDCPECG